MMDGFGLGAGTAHHHHAAQRFDTALRDTAARNRPKSTITPRRARAVRLPPPVQ